MLWSDGHDDTPAKRKQRIEIQDDAGGSMLLKQSMNDPKKMRVQMVVSLDMLMLKKCSVNLIEGVKLPVTGLMIGGSL